jgi:tetratricopeptide (TPR) repeat protein
MKRLLFFILLSQFIFAQSGFENGNTLYKQGKYEEAISAYETIFRSKKESSELYFNLGNCYYKLNKVGPTIYNFEKAILLNPENEQAKNNLELAQKMRIDDIQEIPKVGFARIFRAITSQFHYDTWAWISVGLGVLVLLLFSAFYFIEKSVVKRIFFSGMLVVLFVMLLSILASFFEKNQSNKDNPVIIFAEQTSLKFEAKPTSKDLKILHEGTKVFIESSKNNFKKVRLTDGTIGWIESETLKELK